MTDTKRCGTCGIEKPVTAFHRNRTKPDGLMARCKACRTRVEHRIVTSTRAIRINVRLHRAECWNAAGRYWRIPWGQYNQETRTIGLLRLEGLEKAGWVVEIKGE